MPLDNDTVKKIIDYVDRYALSTEVINRNFDFIDDDDLRSALSNEYYSARYIYKIGEALGVSGVKLASHVKFQIMQYASIYEAIICHMLWGKYKDDPAVKSIENTKSYRKSSQLPRDVEIKNTNGDNIILCVEQNSTIPKNSIKFDDKVDASVKIGFLDYHLGEEIKIFYRLRNGIHIQNAVSREIEYDITYSLLAYRRMMPFTQGVRAFSLNGVLPDSSKLNSEDEGTLQNEDIADAKVILESIINNS